MSKNILVCVAWPYVNGDLHPGHFSGAFLPADIFARYKRAKGENILMVSGSDCYGTPITIEADKLGKTPEEIVDLYHPRVVELFKLFELDYDIYTKTSTKNHSEVFQELFTDLVNSGKVVKKTTKQFYSKEDKKFLPDRYVEGTCPHCKSEHQRSDQCEVCGKLLSPEEVIEPYSKLTKSKVELKDTEHFFIDLPSLSEHLKNFIESHKDIWRNDAYAETKAFIDAGLTDRSLTRDIDWGVEIPDTKLEIEGKEHKRFYVWFDAVTGYLSATKEYFKLEDKKVNESEYIYRPGTPGKWEDYFLNPDSDHYYFMGKDNLLFHTIIWPSLLIGSGKGYTLPYFIARNQFLNLEGKKFSKSRGWMIDSKRLIEKYGSSTVRFYLASNFPESKDANFSWKDFIESNNSILVGNIGNFINRTLSFISSNFEGKVPSGSLDEKVKAEITKTFEDTSKSLDKVREIEALNRICELGSFGNKYFNDQKPWESVKSDKAKSENCLYNSVQIISALATLLNPFIPSGSKEILTQLGVTDSKEMEKYLKWDHSVLANGNILNHKGPIFTKIDPKMIEEEEKALGEMTEI